MLCVNWSAIHAECLMPHERTHSCDLLSVAIHKHPLRDHSRGLVSVSTATACFPVAAQQPQEIQA
jgi:hypothetical protein